MPAQNSDSNYNKTPPEGTYPSPNSPMPDKVTETKSKRVGTVTMACSLIVIGVLLITYIFIPEMDLFFILRFSPAIIILLGVEILVASIRNKNIKMNYDGLSIFIVFILIAASSIAALVPVIISNNFFSPHERARINTELEQKSYDALKSDNDIYSITWLVDFPPIYSGNQQEKSIDMINEARVKIRFNKEFKTEEEFAQACHYVLQELKPLVPMLNYASFYSYPEDNYYSEEQHLYNNLYELWLDGVFQINWDAKTMADNCYTRIWNGKEYLSRPEYNAWNERINAANIAPENEQGIINNLPLGELTVSSDQPVFDNFSLVLELNSYGDFIASSDNMLSGYLEVYVVDYYTGNIYFDYLWNSYNSDEHFFSLEPGTYLLEFARNDFSGSFEIKPQ